jgi:hypothetical protein
MAVGLADVVHAADGWMRHLSRRANLVVQLRQPHGITGDGAGQEIEGNRLTEAQIVGAIDFAHAATAEESDDAIAAVEQRPWREAPMVDGIGRGEPTAGARFRVIRTGRAHQLPRSCHRRRGHRPRRAPRHVAVEGRAARRTEPRIGRRHGATP